MNANVICETTTEVCKTGDVNAFVDINVVTIPNDRQDNTANKFSPPSSRYCRQGVHSYQQFQKNYENNYYLESLRECVLFQQIDEWIERKQFTPLQIQKMEKFRQQIYQLGLLTNWWDNIHLFSRFCEAHEWNVDKAIKMFVNHINWRKEEVGGLLDEIVYTPEYGHVPRFLVDFKVDGNDLMELKRMYPSCYHKVDKLGRPVYYDRVGQVDASQLLKLSSLKTIRNLFIWSQEATIQYRLPAASLHAGYLITECLYVIDLDGLRLDTFNGDIRSVLKQISAIGADHYPQTMAAIYIVNAPLFFRMIWKSISPLLRSNVKSSIFILGGREQYLPVLRNLINDNDLPTFLGGHDTSLDYILEQGPWAGLMPSVAVY